MRSRLLKAMLRLSDNVALVGTTCLSSGTAFRMTIRRKSSPNERAAFHNNSSLILRSELTNSGALKDWTESAFHAEASEQRSKLAHSGRLVNRRSLKNCWIVREISETTYRIPSMRVIPSRGPPLL
jgi:hypothetical protein